MSIEQVVAYWAQGEMSHVRPTECKSVHLDELIADLPDSLEDRIQVAKRCLGKLVEVVGDRAIELQAMLSWPLEDSDSLLVTPPERLEWGNEPPSLYLIDRKGALLVNELEEYRVCVDGAKYGINLTGVFAAYHCTRNREAMVNGWEYGRWFMFSHFPDELVPGTEKP